MRSKFELEAKLLVAVKHVNIVKVQAVNFDTLPHFIVLELLKGDLKSYLEDGAVTVTPSDMVGCITQIADAMAYLETRRVIHRDLAARCTAYEPHACFCSERCQCRNVLVGFQGLSVVKLNDLGLSRSLSTSAYYKKTGRELLPVKWMSVEALLDRKYSSASDVWAFGVLCWEVFSRGDEPYSDMTAQDAAMAVLQGHRLERPEACPENLCAHLVSQRRHALICALQVCVAAAVLAGASGAATDVQWAAAEV